MAKKAENPLLAQLDVALKSCISRVGALEEQVRMLELRDTEKHIMVLDTMEKISARLADRERKRAPVTEEQIRKPRPWERHGIQTG